MPVVKTPFGSIRPNSHDTFASGGIRSCIVKEPFELLTPFGTIVPQYTSNTLRKRRLPCITFHPNGMFKSIPLEEQTVIETPLGPMPAEFITMYDDGSIKRVFPLNGCLSGYWTQEDEAKLAEPLSIPTPASTMNLPLISVYFSPEGYLRSLTFWPGAAAEVSTPIGVIPARIGIRFHDSGPILSLEPARPTPVKTPIGELLAFDTDAVGISADENSLRFTENGSLKSLVTTAHSFEITAEDGPAERLEPPLRLSYCDDEHLEPTPLRITFSGPDTIIKADGMEARTVPTNRLRPVRYTPPVSFDIPSCGLDMPTL